PRPGLRRPGACAPPCSLLPRAGSMHQITFTSLTGLLPGLENFAPVKGVYWEYMESAYRGGRRAPLLALAASLLLAGCGTASGVASASAATTQPYVLFAPIVSNNIYLMDLNGQLVHQWSSSSAPACSVVLLDDGTLLRPRTLGADAFPGGGCNGGRV